MGKRSRKRTGPGERRTSAVAAPGSGKGAAAKRVPDRVAGTRAAQRIDGRPKPLWDPLPLTEVAIGLGVLIAIVGFARGVDTGATLIGIGILMATAGVIELCAREHFSGFKSHTLLLAFLPVVILHSVIRLYISDAYEGPLSLLTDLAVFGVLSMVLLDRFRKARPRKGR